MLLPFKQSSGLLAVLIVGLAVLSGCTSQTGYSGKYSASSENYPAVRVCSGYGCIHVSQLQFSNTEYAHIAKTMGAAKSAKAERQAVKKLVGWKEKIAERKFSFPKDEKLSYQRNRGIRGQMDCIDESSNSLAFLEFLYKQKLLKFHRPKGTLTRGFFFDLRYPHTTAVMVEKGGVAWAVDSWKKAGGVEPQVMPLSQWKRERTSS